MDCEKAQEHMSLYVDEQLSKKEIEELESHISSCASCRIQFNYLLDIIDNLKSLPQLELPPNFHNELINNINNIDNNVKIEKIKNKRFKFEFNKWKKYSTIVAACFVVVILSILGLNSKKYENYAPSSPNYYSNLSDNIQLTKQDVMSINEELEFNNELNLLSNTGLEKNKIGVEIDNKKIIKTSQTSIEIYDFENTVNQIKQITNNSGGYIENSSSYIRYTDNERNISLKSGNITLKVPSDVYDSTLDIIKNLGNVIENNEYVEDVTAQYIDTESLLKTKRIEEERLLDMMSKTNTIEDLILLEQRLSTVRGELESYTGRINNWDRLVRFSTINVNLIQVKESTLIDTSSNLSGRMKKSFINSINNIQNFVENLAIWIAQIILPFSLCVILLICVVIIIKFIRKNSHK